MFSRFLVSAAVMIGLQFSTFTNIAESAHPRGAKKSPAHKLFSTPRFAKTGQVPESFGLVPAQLSYWGNNVDGDCVSAEEAFAKAAYSVMTAGSAELFVPESTLVNWASQHGFLDGASLTDVMDVMASTGITVNGTVYKDGPYQSVDYTNDAVLSAAIFSGPVKIGVAADQLENVVGTTNGWVATGFTRDSNEDHCTGLCGYGTMAECAKMLGKTLPAGVNATSRGYLFFTWNTIGIIDQPSLIAITSEAWIRTPTTPGNTPNPSPTPPPNPAPNPTPPGPTPPPAPVNTIVGYTSSYSGSTSRRGEFTIPSLPVYAQQPSTAPCQQTYRVIQRHRRARPSRG